MSRGKFRCVTKLPLRAKLHFLLVNSEQAVIPELFLP